MAINYAGLAKTAGCLITDSGVAMTMESIVEGAFDPATGEQSRTTTSVEVTAVLLGVETTWLDGTLVQTGDARALIKANDLTTTPKQGFYLVAPTQRYYISEVKPLSPDDTTVLLYKATLTIGTGK